jgi:branched-subunit amino acid ABC-type transport system permease component
VIINVGFEPDLLKPVLVLGVVQAGLYGLLPISLVLSYRVSRTIAFVHGGIAAAAALLYWWFAYPEGLVAGDRPELDPRVALLLVVAMGAAMGGAYGLIVTRPAIIGASRMSLTVFSLGTMLLVIGLFTFRLPVVSTVAYPPNPFGEGGAVTLAGVVVTKLRLATLICTVVIIAALIAFTSLTRAGLHMRAVADDVEAAGWCGVEVARIGTGVYVVAGSIAALAGGLICPTIGNDPVDLIILLLRALTVGAIGGLMSLPLAITGALALAMVDTATNAGLFGGMSLGTREIVLNAALIVLILSVARTQGANRYMLSRQSL